jgi:hypothetical protein
MVQIVQKVQSLRSVQAPTSVLPRGCGGGLRRVYKRFERLERLERFERAQRFKVLQCFKRFTGQKCSTVQASARELLR